MSTFENKLPDDLKIIWDLTNKLKIDNTLDTSDAWMRLEQRLDIKQDVISKIKPRKSYSLIQPLSLIHI